MAAPSYVNAGTGATDSGGAWSYTCQASAAAGRVFIVQILQDGATSGALSSVVGTNIENLGGTDNVWTAVAINQPVGSPTAALQHIYIGRALSTSAPTISGANSTSEDLYIRSYQFTDVSTGTTLATVVENGAGTSANGVGSSNTASDTAVATLGPARLALNFLAVDDDNALAQFSGQSGGTWTEVAEYANSSGTDGAIQMQYASMPGVWTIDGGTASITDSDNWGVVGFALIGTTASAPQSMTPGVLSLTTSLFAPTVTVTDNVTVTPAPVVGGASYSDTILADNPVAYWRLGETSGTTADNAEGTATYDGTYSGGYDLGETGALTGDSDKALGFTNNTGGVIVAHNAALNLTTNFSLEAWVSRHATGADYYKIIKKGSSGSYCLEHDGSGVLYFSNNLVTEAHSSISLTADVWYHVVVTYGAGSQTAKIWINGVDRTTTDTGCTFAGNTDAIGIGSNHLSLQSLNLGAFLDEVAIYDSVVLSSTQIAAHYAAASGGGLVLTTFAPTVTVGANVTVTPDLVALTTSLFAPTVTAPDPQTATPGLAELTTTTFAPTVTALSNVTATPDVVVLVTETFAPVVTATDHKTATPDLVALTTTAYEPTVTASDHQTATPDVASLTTATFAPTVATTDNQLATPDLAELALTGYEPTVTATDHQTATPDLAELTTATFAPVVTASDHQLSTPDLAELALASFAPTVTASDNITATLDIASLVTEAFAPTVTTTAHVTATPDVTALVTETFAPTVTADGSQTATPDVTALALTAFAPDVFLSDHQTATPDLATLTTATFAPTVTASDHQSVTPDTATLLLTAFAPTVTATDNVTVTPDAAALVMAMFAPTVTVEVLNQLVTRPLALTLTGYPPIVTGDPAAGGSGGRRRRPVPPVVDEDDEFVALFL